MRIESFPCRLSSLLESTLKCGLGLALSLALTCPQLVCAATGFSVTPSTVDSGYSGDLVFHVTGLIAGETVVVQRFLDVNSNEVIDAPDLLWQQFSLTDGQASTVGGVTNINIPADSDAVPGQITARVGFRRTDPDLNLIGRYGCKLSSPTGRFTPITNSFSIISGIFEQSLKGHVVNSGTNVPHAFILLFTPPERGETGTGWAVDGGVADVSGAYDFKLHAGLYIPAAFKSGYLCNVDGTTNVLVSPGQTVTNNIVLQNATRTISGRLADAAQPSIGLPGFFVHATAGGVAAAATSDTNGDFTLQVTSGKWRFGENGEVFHGYVRSNSDAIFIDTTTGNVSGLVITYPKATALFYGSVRDDQNRPVAGVNMYVENDAESLKASVFTDTNGAYALGVLGGQPWYMQVDNSQLSATNYIFSQGFYTNLGAGQTVLVNFTALPATNRITGQVRDHDGAPLPNVRVYTYGIFGGLSYGADTKTDDQGRYALNVANGSWGIAICCSCSGWPSGYCCPSARSVTVSNADVTADLISPGRVHITTPTPLPDGYVGEIYEIQFAAQTCAPNATWETTNPPPGLSLSFDGSLSGFPEMPGSNYVFVQMYDGYGNLETKGFSLVIQPARTGGFSYYYLNKLRSYRQAGAANVVLDESRSPFNAYLGVLQDSLDLVTNASCLLPTGRTSVFPPGLSSIELQTHEAFSNEAALDPAYPVGDYVFTMATRNQGNQSHILTLEPAPYPQAPCISNYAAAQAIDPNEEFILEWNAFEPLSDLGYIQLIITEDSQVPAFAARDTDLAASIVLRGRYESTTTSGLVHPYTLQIGRKYLGVLQFVDVAGVNDLDDYGYGEALLTAQTVFSLATVSARPLLSAPQRSSSTEFRFLASGLAGHDYTIERTTNLASTNWLILYTTNAPAASFLVIDAWATNTPAFYRVLFGP